MPIQRVFLDWRQPALPAAADWLIGQRSSAGRIDLQHTIVVVPGARAGRRLLELLLDRVDQPLAAIVPPRIVTVGRVPELLYEARRPFAESLTQRLAWAAALQSISPEQLQSVVRIRPADDDLDGWLSLGETLARVHLELARDQLEFADVLAYGREIADFDEHARWQALASIQHQYLGLLDGLELWDRETARLYAIKHRECRTDAAIVLVGTVDLNRATRAMLDQVADRVTALVFAPESLARRFDEHGCLLPEAWQEATIDGVFERSVVVDGPADQAAAVVQTIAAYDGRFAAEEITVGLADESLAPWVEQRLQEAGLPARYGVGRPVVQSGPCRLLDDVAAYLDGHEFAAFAALVRHPDVERRLLAGGLRGAWLTELDVSYSRHLPATLERDGLPQLPAARPVVEQIQTWLDPLRGARRSPAEWAVALTGLLVTVYGDRPLNRDDPRDRLVLIGCEQIYTALQDLEAVPERLAPRVTAAEVIRHVFDALDSERIPPPSDEASIELLGWLELPLDDAPALIVTGFNEGAVPSSRNSDAFLPNALRTQLGLEDNSRRFARDAYALSVLSASRRELKLIVGRRSAARDPLVPSRLLFAGPESDLPRRTLALFAPPARSGTDFTGSGTVSRPSRISDRRSPDSEHIDQSGDLRSALWRGRETSPQHSETSPQHRESSPQRKTLAIPPPVPLAEPVTSMRVTEFADYLKCPYRYYLRHRLGLKSLDTAAEELDGGAFGNLVHDVLQAFGDDADVKSSTSADQIFEFLSNVLDVRSQSQFGPSPRPAVGVQVEHVRLRLKAFAEWQARWSAEGWRIVLTEATVARDNEAALLMVDGAPMCLSGRIDRIDWRETPAGREFVLFDYKTGDAGVPPDKRHRDRDGQWVDLQLPLYRQLVRGLPEIACDGPVKLGYILLPKDLSCVGPQLAGWTDDELAEAEALAREVVRKVRRNQYWPPADSAFGFDEFAAICQEQLPGTNEDETP